MTSAKKIERRETVTSGQEQSTKGPHKSVAPWRISPAKQSEQLISDEQRRALVEKVQRPGTTVHVGFVEETHGGVEKIIEDVHYIVVPKGREDEYEILRGPVKDAVFDPETIRTGRGKVKSDPRDFRKNRDIRVISITSFPALPEPEEKAA